MRNIRTCMFALVCLVLAGCQISNTATYDSTLILPRQFNYTMQTQGVSYNGVIRVIDAETYCKVTTTIDEHPSRIFTYSSPTRDFYQIVDADGTVNTIDKNSRGSALEYFYDINSIITVDEKPDSTTVYTDTGEYTLSQNHVISANIISGTTEKDITYSDFKDYTEPLDLSPFEIPEDILQDLARE